MSKSTKERRHVVESAFEEMTRKGSWNYSRGTEKKRAIKQRRRKVFARRKKKEGWEWRRRAKEEKWRKRRRRERFCSVDRRFSYREIEKIYIILGCVCAWNSLKGAERVVSSLIPVIRFPLNGFAMVCTRAILAGVER